MPLQKQVIQIPFQGLQTKIDPKMAPVGTFSTVDNFVMEQFPELKKRDGLQILGESTTPSNINQAYSLANEVGVITESALYSYSPSIDEFQLKGLTASPSITSKPVISSTYTYVAPSSATSSNGLIATIYGVTSALGPRCSIKDIASDTFIVSDHRIEFATVDEGVSGKVIAIGEDFYFFWCTTSLDIIYTRTYFSQTQTFSNAAVAANAKGITFGLLEVAGNILVVHNSTDPSPDVIRAFYWNVADQAVGGPANGLPAPTSLGFSSITTLGRAISITAASEYFACAVFNEDTNEVFTRTFDFSFVPLTAETDVTGGTPVDALGQSVSICVDTLNNTYVFFSTYSTPTLAYTTYITTISDNTTTPVVATYSVFYRQMVVCSSAFFYENNAYVVLCYPGATTNSIQSTYFGVRYDGACFGRMFAQLGVSDLDRYMPPGYTTQISSVTSIENTFIFSLLKLTRFQKFKTFSVYTEQIKLTPRDVDNKVLSDVLNLSGGYLKQYDGTPTVFEQGFHLYPEGFTLAQTVPGSGDGHIAVGTYAYTLCWEWVDNLGNLFRSAPAIPQTIVVTAADTQVTITVPPLPITNKETRFGDTRSEPILAVYRTLTLGTTYFRVNNAIVDYVYNQPTNITISYQDNSADADISSNPILYTTGGVFENIALPATNLMAISKNRIFVAGADTDPYRIYYSKEKEEGIAVEFAAELSLIVDSTGGEITTIAAMDDKVLFFKKSFIYYIGASSLLDKVGNGTAPVPILISSDTGCESPQSVVLTGDGIMFQSQKGIYLAGRQLDVSYVGQAVDRITQDPDFQISSVVNLPDKNRVYFTDLNNSVLVYDTFFQQWYTHALPFSPVASASTGSVWYTASSSYLYKAIPGLATDGGKSVISTLKTNWISVAKLEGFARIYAILILGDNAELAHRLSVNIYYDFENFPRETVSIVPDSLSGADYGADSPYGSGTPFGSVFDGTYQFVIRPREQKCTSIRLEIFDQFPTGDNTTSFKFSGISLVVGMKSSYNKNLPYTRRLT